ncbi:peptidase domain-containing ABC transporter [Streptococcus caviae]|uniref:peptidase domain-containing ABC transporter n=1 Tax=Streptococcus sp. 'caviae' TaxID=1915004 RepID=UPI00094B94DF|nr:peptidase domain-containing ABC transporter [Streptococcus sp. 'caviae']OLN84802.1 peptidase C39 [Streptococcus sp. 'caviae']
MKKRITLLEQTTPTECGLCCLYMILDYFDIQENFFELKQKINVGRNGLSIQNVTDIAKNYGISCQTYRFHSTPHSFPAMAFVNEDHFVILENFRKGKYSIVDPAVGRYVLNKEEFQEMTPKFYTLFLRTNGLSSLRSISSHHLILNNAKNLILSHRKIILLTVICTFLFQLFTVTVPFFMKNVIDDTWNIRKSFTYYEMTLLFLAIMCIQSLIFFLKNIFLALLQNGIHRQISDNFVSKLLKLPLADIANMDRTDIIHRYNGIIIVREMVSERILAMWLDIILMLASLCYVFFVSVYLGLVLLIVFITESTVFFAVLRAKQEKLGKEVLKQKKLLQTFFSLVDSLFVLKAKNTEQGIFSKWQKDFTSYTDAAYDRAKHFNILGTINYFVTFSVPIFIVILFLYLSNQQSSGEIILLYMMALNFVNPINTILNSIDEMLYSLKHYERALEINSLTEETLGGYQLSKDHDLTIRLDQIGYKYEFNSQEVLKNISLTIHPGEFIAVIGKSGSGKSSLAKLLLGHVIPTVGQLSYNDIDYQSVDKRDLRNLSSIVLQDVPILDGSLRYNITLDRVDITDEDVIEMCKKVSIYDDIKNMPMGLDTPLSKDNLTLSGGQKQRLSLARELISKPRLIVLDEPTSALDVETEKVVQRSIEALNCTRVLVTHRLNTIEKADKIIMMDSGKITDSGTHDVLYSRNKTYRDMYDSYMNKYNKELE